MVETGLELILPAAPQYRTDDGAPWCRLAFPCCGFFFFFFSPLLFGFSSLHTSLSFPLNKMFAASKIITGGKKGRRDGGVHVAPMLAHGRLFPQI